MLGGDRARNPWVIMAVATLAGACSADREPDPRTLPGDGGDSAADAVSTTDHHDAAAADASLGDSPGDSPEDSLDGRATSDSSDASVDAVDERAADGETAEAGPAPPLLLSQTGLFAGTSPDGGLALADGVEAYQPKYTLWSDGADKQRWVYLPPGSTIDTSNPDHWSFPVGTKFWKEFALAGQRIETRLLWRFGAGPNDFVYAAYHWQAATDGGPPTDAVVLSPTSMGVRDANGTSHDIPSVADCIRCHGREPEHVLGFGAIQLSHNLTGITLAVLNANGWTSPPLEDNYPIPGTTVEQAALGYLHANCGNCHNDVPGLVGPPYMNLRVYAGTATVQETNAFLTAVNQPVTKFVSVNPKITYRIAGGDSASSCVWFRMSVRSATDNSIDARQMPPLATEQVDTAGLTAVGDWIATLPPPADP